MSEDIWIVVPAYEEEERIGQVLEGLKEQGYDQIIVVDDGSDDRTADIAREKGAETVEHEENKGLGAALRSGLNEARELEAEVVVTFDADGQHRPEDIPRLLDALEGGDFAVGVRKKNQMPLDKRLGNSILDVITKLFGGPWTDSQSGFRAFGPKSLEKIRIKSDRYSVSSEIIVQVGEKDLSFKTVPIEGIFTEYSRGSGTTIASGIRIFFDLIRLKAC